MPKKLRAIPPAPRGFYRGPLPLPGREPVSLDAYRSAAIRKCKVKHRDQARDKWILARNRRAQLSAGYCPAPAYTQPQQYPMLEGPGQMPLQIAAPPMYQQAVPQIMPPAYGFPSAQVMGAPAYSSYAMPQTYAPVSTPFMPSTNYMPTYGSPI